MKYTVFLALTFIYFFPFSTLAQTKNTIGERTSLHNSGKGQQNNNTGSGTQKIYNNQKTYNNTTIYNQINESNESKILLVNKYLDLTKYVLIKSGSNAFYLEPSLFLDTFSMIPYGYITPTEDSVAVIKYNFGKGQLFIDGTITGIDATNAVRIEKNKLIPNPEYQQYASDKWIEIVDKHNIPVLQVILSHEENSIELNYLNFETQTLAIASKKGYHQIPFSTPFLLMNPMQRDSVLYELIKVGRQEFKPLH